MLYCYDLKMLCNLRALYIYIYITSFNIMYSK